MVAIRYYRQYLWIFFYLFFLLMLGGLAVDTYMTMMKTKELKLVRFLNVIICFFFSGLSIVLQHFAARKLFGLKYLYDRKRWNRKKIRVKKKSFRKVAKRRNFVLFFLINSFAMFLAWVPIIVVFILKAFAAEAWNTIENNWFNLEFFCGALLIKYVSKYLALLTSRFSIFLNKRRLNELV